MSEKLIDHNEMKTRAYEVFVSDAGFELQALVLGISADELIAKHVLEIGSGRTNRFVRESEPMRPAFITSINPQLTSCETREVQNIDVAAHLGSVAALAQGYLPFRRESFDTVTSVLGVPNALLSSELPAALNDIWRVLKPGGIARLWPFAYKKDGHESVKALDYLALETVDSQVLEALPEPYASAKQRIVINKPIAETTPITDTLVV